MKKTIIAIVGRSCSGKDTLTHVVSEALNVPIVCSNTDRPMRPLETNGVEHYFMSEKQMDNLVQNKSNLFAYTKIGKTGFRYCVTKDYIDSLPGNAVFYIIDPNGIEYLKKHSSEYDLQVINIRADYETRKSRAAKRNGELEAFLKREKDEKDQFDNFENNNNNSDYIICNEDGLGCKFEARCKLETIVTAILDKTKVQTDIERGEKE